MLRAEVAQPREDLLDLAGSSLVTLTQNPSIDAVSNWARSNSGWSMRGRPKWAITERKIASAEQSTADSKVIGRRRQAVVGPPPTRIGKSTALAIPLHEVPERRPAQPAGSPNQRTREAFSSSDLADPSTG